MAHWQEALRTDPGVFEAHLSLAIALFDMERLPEARLHASMDCASARETGWPHPSWR